jgi:hypothetical protein
MSTFNLDIIEYLKTTSAQQGIVSLRQFEGELRLLAEAKPDDLKIVVFIDDLDRCEPDVLWQVMVAQQLLVLSSKCIFVLAMDLDIVSRTLEKMLAEHSQTPDESGHSFQHGRGYDFLEKIIQTRISIPHCEKEQMKEFVEKLASEPDASQSSHLAVEWDRSGEPIWTETAEDSPDLRRAIMQYGPANFDNPRRLKRYVNALRLQVYLAQASGFHINVDELARFLVLIERWPRLVEDFLRNTNRQQVLQKAEVPSEPQNSERDAWWERWKFFEEIYPDVEIPQDALALLDGIDAERLRALCNWYGFRYYGNREALKLAVAQEK